MSDILGPAPQPLPVNITIAPEINVGEFDDKISETTVVATPTETVISDAPTARETPPAQETILAPRGVADMPTKPPVSDLQRDLYAKLEAIRNRPRE
jgi:hypothetical protein